MTFARYGWRSFFWFSTGLSALVLLLVLAFMPETKFHREPRTTEPATASATVHEPAGNGADKEIHQTEHSESLDLDATTGGGQPSSKQYQLIQRPHCRWKEFLFRDFIAPVRVAFFPIVSFAALNIGGQGNMFLFWNLTESSVLSGPPHNFTESQVGYANFGFAIGALLGLAVTGPFSDWVANMATRRNRGVREAEMRLPALLPFLVLTVVGSVVGGL